MIEPLAGLFVALPLTKILGPLCSTTPGFGTTLVTCGLGGTASSLVSVAGSVATGFWVRTVWAKFNRSLTLSRRLTLASCSPSMAKSLAAWKASVRLPLKKLPAS